ncbi:chondroitin proteoglycan 1-like isoform X2 [Diorhabda carinulata]|uniref:chondroitin proteoglycan 1-like isoform X2 n=1 Tax=Diorhabda carinulata TaxID=1163345 RepID=UPI0025A2C9EA|nr:chondroitin proteoglycan 1-like isoform X2 [Diorhabda carinulata]
MYSQRLFYFLLSIVAVKTYPDCPRDGSNAAYFPNKEDCGSFWQCSNGLPYLFNCPANLHFNPELNVCDYPQNVGCVISTEDSSETTTADKTQTSITEETSPYTSTTASSTTSKVPSMSTTTTSTKSTACTKSRTRKTIPVSSEATITTSPITTQATTSSLIISTSVSTEAILSTTSENVYTTKKTTSPDLSTVSLITSEISNTTTSLSTVTSQIQTKDTTATLSTIPSQIPTEDTTSLSTISSQIPSEDVTSLSTISSQIPIEDATSLFTISSQMPTEYTFLSTISSTIPTEDITTTVATTENMDYVCADLSSEYFIAPHPNDCTSFVACSYGTAYVMKCNNNLWFNSQLISCVEPAKSNCKISRVIPIRLVTLSCTTSSDNLISICYKNDDGSYLQHPSDCDKFIICVHGFPITMYCPEGLQFSLSKQQCVYPHDTDCNLGS